MKAAISVLFLAGCLVPLSSFALEVPIPELVGIYPSSEGSVVVSVDFGQPILDVSQVYLELEGTLAPSWYTAYGDTLDWFGSFSACFCNEGPGWWLTGMDSGSSGEGEFYSLTAFRGSSTANPDILLDGRADLLFEFTGAGFPEADQIGPYPTGTISSAALIYNGPVAVDSESWGSVKARYRH